VYFAKSKKKGEMFMTIVTLDNLCWRKLPLTKVGSMSGGNQKGWFTDTINAPPKTIT
jgi:hypothetical protein